MALNTVPVTPAKVVECLSTLYKLRMPCMLHGSPGIGKTTIVNQFAQANGMEVRTQILAQIEPSDIRGIPTIHDESRTVIWYTPNFLPPSDSTSKGIIFFDELSNARPEIQVVAYQLLLERRIGTEYTLPDDWWVVAAGNGLEDGCNVYEMSSALADRMVHFNVTADPEQWVGWALNEGNIAPEVITFIKVKPDFLVDGPMNLGVEDTIKPTPRSWEKVSDVLKIEKNQQVLDIIISGILGRAATAEFFQVIEELKLLPPIEDFFNAPDDVAIVNLLKPLNTIASLYGLCYSIVGYANDLDKFVQATGVFNLLVTITDALPRAEIQTLGMELLMTKVIKSGRQMDYMKSPEFKAYSKKLKKVTSVVTSK